MISIDLYDAVYKGALAKKARESQARNAAVKAVEEYKKGRMKNVNTLVKEWIKNACKGIC